MVSGLSNKEVDARKRKGQANIQPDRSAKSTKDIVKENVLTYFNLIFAVLAVFVILVGDYRSLTFLFVVVANALIGIIQELHAKNVLDRLSLLNQPTAIVIREGERRKVPTQELVLDDCIELTAGSQIPADAKVVEGEITVNEALLTGEADEIIKRPGDVLMSGSFVVSGECAAQLTAVGAHSYISRLMVKAKRMKSGEQSEMVKSINRVVIAAGIAIVPVGIGLFYQSYVVGGNDIRTSVTGMVAALVGMIPEGLYLLVSMVLAVSAARLASKQVMLHDMKSIETLARVDVLCLDKTGTITDNSMLVAKCILADDGGEMTRDDAAYRVISSYISVLPDDNATMRAMREYFGDTGAKRAASIMPFSSAYKYSSVTFNDDTFLLGAPDRVLASSYEKHRSTVEEYAAKGYRVMVFASLPSGRRVDASSPLNAADEPEAIAFVLLMNPVRESAPRTLEYFRRQGVSIKVISGDHPVTVSEVARQAGISEAEKYVDAASLKSDEEIYRAANEYTVFGRTTPEVKQKLIKALKKKGHTVAMTGDGVNDILAMKTADCSVAMAAGSDAAAQAAQVVLLDSDFAKMPSIVAQGRQCINNLERSATLFLVKNMFSLFLAVFSIVSVLTYPLNPSQISLISLFTIGAPAFCLAIEPNTKRIEDHFLIRVLIKAMPAALTNFFVIAAMVVFGETFLVADDDVSVAATFLMAIVGFMILIRISSPMNLFHGIVLGGCVAGFCVVGYFLRELFSISSISTECIMLFVLFAIATEPLMRYLTMLFDRIGARLRALAG